MADGDIMDSDALDAAYAFEQELAGETVAKLRKRCTLAGKRTRGSKVELIERLIFHTHTPTRKPVEASPPTSPTPKRRRQSRGPVKAAAAAETSAAPPPAIPPASSADVLAEVATAFGLIVLVLGVATEFYRRNNNWTAAESFWYAVDTTLSIGTGVDGLADSSDATMLFTLCNVLMGALWTAHVLLIIVDIFTDGTVATWFAPQPGLLGKLLSPLAFAVYGWIAVGTAVGMQIEGWTAVQSLYYATTQLATGGLRAPSRQDDSLLFTAVFALIGVPLFAAWTASVATELLASVTQARLRARLQQAKMHAAAAGVDGTAAKTDWGTFLAAQLTQAGLVDEGAILKIKAQFQRRE